MMLSTLMNLDLILLLQLAPVLLPLLREPRRTRRLMKNPDGLCTWLRWVCPR